MNLHLTTNEIFEKYPELQIQFNWTKRTISLFMRNKLLAGYYNRNKRTTIIKESSLLQLIEFIKEPITENY
jgi:hypothetical protein